MRVAERAAYGRAMAMGECVWALVETWSAFERGTLGRPLVRAVDAVAAGLSGGCGRVDTGGRPRFAACARAALCEAETWLAKAHRRGLIPDHVYAPLERDVEVLFGQLARRRPPLRRSFHAPATGPPAGQGRRQARRRP